MSDEGFLYGCGTIRRLKYVYIEQSCYSECGLTFKFLDKLLEYTQEACFKSLKSLCVSTKTSRIEEVVS